MTMPNRISPKDIEIAAKRIWPNQLVAKTIVEETVGDIRIARERRFSFFNGKSAKGIVGGLFYLLGYKYGCIKKQRELSDILETNDVTIRASYRGWLEEFPDLFQDVIGKLAQDQNLRWYVLVDYRRKVNVIEAPT